MAILLCVGRSETETRSYHWFINEWREILLSLDPTLDIRVWPDYGDVEEIDCVLAWHHVLGILQQFPNLKCILSCGAGVDHIFDDTQLPQNIPIARIVDPAMVIEIVQYVVVTVLNHIKIMDRWKKNQPEKLWDKKPPFNYGHKTVGIMGLGLFGAKAAQALTALGVQVIGWSKSKKRLPHITDYIGDTEFNEFLSHSDILVCLLPLTNETENILNKDTFAKLPQNAYVINLARGRHVVDADLIAALDAGQLSGACLDVFRKEPLPTDHPFWTHPKIRVTPHIASVTNPKTAALQVLDNIRRALAGQALLNTVDVAKGY